MSRIGKLPVHLGKGVDCKIVDGNIIVKGPKGEVTMHVLPMVGVDIKDGVVHFTQLNETRESNANMGTMRALVNDMNKGVTVGFEKKLTLVGVGYRAQAQGDKLNLQIGFSHPPASRLQRRARPRSSSRAPTSRRSVRPLPSSAAIVPRNPIRARASVMPTNMSSSRKPRRSKAGT